jgi:hypothetical protein
LVNSRSDTVQQQHTHRENPSRSSEHNAGQNAKHTDSCPCHLQAYWGRVVVRRHLSSQRVKPESAGVVVYNVAHASYLSGLKHKLVKQ